MSKEHHRLKAVLKDQHFFVESMKDLQDHEAMKRCIEISDHDMLVHIATSTAVIADFVSDILLEAICIWVDSNIDKFKDKGGD